MPYLYNTPSDVREMLAAIGVGSVEELLAMVPAEFRLNRPLELPPAMAEMELDQHLRRLAERNDSVETKVCFLGGGAYDHFVPAVVDAIGSRGEFYTSYTPYQPEVAQGNLQAMFEYQTLVCRLTGLDLSNSSLYDGASAAAEAVLMALASQPGRKRVLLPESLHPEYRETISTYVANLGVELVLVASRDGVVDPDALDAELDGRAACLLLQQPNFFGCIEDADRVTAATHAAGALLVSVFDPISLGLLKRPGDYHPESGGADIAVAEGQSLGSPLQLGGPYLGILACREKLVRRMPGRIVGQTVDKSGARCFVLTLQTREQHIRRDKATSNVCSNQALFALRATVYLAQLGPHGLQETANLCLQKSRYLMDRLCATGRFAPAFGGSTFKEFVLRDQLGDVEGLVSDALDAGFFAGIPLGRMLPAMSDCLLVAVTEKRTREEMDRFVRFVDATVRYAKSDKRALAPA